ncbi:MAG: signal peptidase [Actinomycetota bacterium]
MHRVQNRRTVTSLTPRATTPLSRRASAAIIVGAAVASVIVDQITKSIAEASLADGPVRLLFGARLVLTYNSGAAFSVGTGRSAVFTLVASVTITGLTVYAFWVKHRPAQAVAFGLIIGGAAGNLVDRLVRGNGGRVIDFVEIARWWPVFNWADASLFCGVALLLLLSYFDGRDEPRRP